MDQQPEEPKEKGRISNNLECHKKRRTTKNLEWLKQEDQQPGVPQEDGPTTWSAKKTVRTTNNQECHMKIDKQSGMPKETKDNQ